MKFPHHHFTTQITAAGPELLAHIVKEDRGDLSFPSQYPNFLLFHSNISVKMAPASLPSIFNATSQDIEMLIAANCHVGSKNLQTHMQPYLWKTRADGVNVINIGKTWYVGLGDYCVCCSIAGCN